ncbi:MAG: endospore germination permease [Clostridiales bacterium]|nr:endospore germination permease [Clostridiales bacterium]
MFNKISAKQLKYAVSAFIMASSLLTSHLYFFTENESWLSVLLGFVASFIMIGIYSALSKRYPGKNLIDITTAVFGRVLGTGISLFYVFYFLSLSYLNTRNLGDFIKGSVLLNTPMTIILVFFVLICAMAVRKGPVVMSRYGLLASVICIAAILINSLLLLNMTEPHNLLPAFNLPLQKYLIGSHFVTMLPFCEIMSFMMFIPDMQKPEGFGRAMRSGLCIGAAVLVTIVLRDIMVLGQHVVISALPPYSTTRMIDVGDILTRLEIVYAVILISLLFFKVSVVYYATVSSVGSLLGKSYRLFIFIFGALIVLYAEASFPASSEHTEWLMTAAATYSSFMLLILPLLTLIVSWIRGSLKNKPESYQEAAT